MTETPNQKNDKLVEEQEALAARDAGAIGGPDPYSGTDVAPEDRPLQEAGQGESEGFEEAEDMLRTNAEHADKTANIEGFPEEPEQDLSGAAYGDADQVVKSSEVVSEGGEPGDASTSS